MKLNTSKLVDLARALVPSAQQAGNDSQLQVPNQVLCVTEIPGQLFSAASPPSSAILSESFEWVNQINVNGAAAAQAVQGPTIAPGLWRFSGHVAIFFSGTANITQEMALTLSPPIGTIYLVRAAGGPQTSQQRFEFLVSLKDQVSIKLQTSAATIGGDLLQMLAVLHASRIL